MMLKNALATIGADLSVIALTRANLVKASVYTNTNLWPLVLVLSECVLDDLTLLALVVVLEYLGAI